MGFIETDEEGISFDEWESYTRLIKYFGNLRPEWGRDGLCYQRHPNPTVINPKTGVEESDYNPWFPEHGKHKLLGAVQRECARCPVREQCFESGWDDEYGVWGGSSEKQRRDWKKAGIPLEEAKVL